MAEIVYVGKGKQGKYGPKINICINDIAEYAKEHIKPAKNGKKYIRLDVVNMKHPDEYGNELTVKIDTWVPEEKKEEKPAEEPQKIKGNPYYDSLKETAEEYEDDVPF